MRCGRAMATTRSSAPAHSSRNGIPAGCGERGATSESEEKVKALKCFRRSRMRSATRTTTASARSSSHGEAKRIMLVSLVREACAPHPLLRSTLSPLAGRGTGAKRQGEGCKLPSCRQPQRFVGDFVEVALGAPRRKLLQIAKI